MVVLLADADMMYNELLLEQDPRTGELANSNFPLMLNAVELMSGGGDLLQVRSRASTRRPFTKMDELRENVEKQYRPRLAQLQQTLQDTVAKMGPLRMSKSGQITMDARQAKELEELKNTQVTINREIREIKKTQTKDINRRQSFITLMNLLAVPLLVVIVGLLLAMRRRTVTAAV